MAPDAGNLLGRLKTELVKNVEAVDALKIKAATIRVDPMIPMLSDRRLPVRLKAKGASRSLENE